MKVRCGNCNEVLTGKEPLWFWVSKGKSIRDSKRFLRCNNCGAFHRNRITIVTDPPFGICEEIPLLPCVNMEHLKPISKANRDKKTKWFRYISSRRLRAYDVRIKVEAKDPEGAEDFAF